MPNDVVIVTGANNGIGLGLTRALHKFGYRVAAIDLSIENIADITSYVCDVTNPELVETTITQIAQKWGRIDVLVNGACRAVMSPFADREIDDIRSELEVNYFGYVNMIKAVLPYMKTQGGGVIHNISSAIGMCGFDGMCGYTSSKGAIEGLSRTLAIECEPYNITVNIMHPPLTRTRSSSPLGIPVQFMADPDIVGLKLARKIGSRKAIVTPGPTEAFGVFMSRFIPGAMGRFLSRKTAEARRVAQ